QRREGTLRKAIEPAQGARGIGPHLNLRVAECVDQIRNDVRREGRSLQKTGGGYLAVFGRSILETLLERSQRLRGLNQGQRPQRLLPGTGRPRLDRLKQGPSHGGRRGSEFPKRGGRLDLDRVVGILEQLTQTRKDRRCCRCHLGECPGRLNLDLVVAIF